MPSFYISWSKRVWVRNNGVKSNIINQKENSIAFDVVSLFYELSNLFLRSFFRQKKSKKQKFIVIVYLTGRII